MEELQPSDVLLLLPQLQARALVAAINPGRGRVALSTNDNNNINTASGKLAVVSDIKDMFMFSIMCMWTIESSKYHSFPL